MSIHPEEPPGRSRSASFPALARSGALDPAINRFGIRPAPLWAGLIALLLALAASLGLAGCGDDDQPKIEGPLAEVLAYMPRDAGLALAAPTEPDRGSLKRLDQLGSRFPAWQKLKRQLEAEVARDADFERELRPQLGNPLAYVLGRNGRDQYAGLKVKDPAAIRRLLERAVARGREERLDDYEGALVTKERRAGRRQPNGDLAVTALHDDILLAAGSEQLVRDAIDRSGGSDNLASDEMITSALGNLGEDTLFRVAGDAQRLLDSAPTSDLAAARQLPWIRALGDFTAHGVVKGKGIDVDFELKTDRVQLRERDLPLAAGPERPLVHAPDAAAILALREPDRLVRFIEAFVRATNAEGYARYRIGVDQLRDLGVDLHEDLLGRIENLSVAVPSTLAATFQADLEKGTGPAFAVALDRAQPFIEETLREFAGGGTIVATGSGERRTYAVERAGITVASFGVRDDALVGIVGLGDLPKPVGGETLEGTEGALVLKGDGDRLVRVPLIRDAIPRGARAVLARLGELKLSVRAETGALTGRAHVEAR